MVSNTVDSQLTAGCLLGPADEKVSGGDVTLKVTRIITVLTDTYKVCDIVVGKKCPLQPGVVTFKASQKIPSFAPGVSQRNVPVLKSLTSEINYSQSLLFFPLKIGPAVLMCIVHGNLL